MVWYIISERKNFTSPPVWISMHGNNDAHGLEGEQALGRIIKGNEGDTGESKVSIRLKE